jgi:hypothetical protein
MVSIYGDIGWLEMLLPYKLSQDKIVLRVNPLFYYEWERAPLTLNLTICAIETKSWSIEC